MVTMQCKVSLAPLLLQPEVLADLPRGNFFFPPLPLVIVIIVAIVVIVAIINVIIAVDIAKGATSFFQHPPPRSHCQCQSLSLSRLKSYIYPNYKIYHNIPYLTHPHHYGCRKTKIFFWTLLKKGGQTHVIPSFPIPYHGRRPHQNNCHHRCIGIGQRGQTILFTFHSLSPLLKSAQKRWRLVQKIHLNNQGRPIKIKIIALSIRAAECNFWQSDAAT